MSLNEESKVALRVAHLTIIQGVITRMSGFSASAKTFAVTILSGLAGISLQADRVQLGVIASFAIIILATIDVYYMTLELQFRSFYDNVVARDLDEAADLNITPLKHPGDILRAIKSNASKLFYIPLLLACASLVVYGLTYDQRPKQLSQPITPCAERRTVAEPTEAAKQFEQFVQPTPARTDWPFWERFPRQPATSDAKQPFGK